MSLYLSRAIPRFSPASSASYLKTRFINTTPAYPGHIPLNSFENAFLAVGSAVMSLLDPYRADLIAALGETTAGPALPRLRDIMLATSEGRRILKDRPRINTRTVDMNALAQLPEGTWGRTYKTWLERTGVTPDSREPVHYIDDPELAYVMQRYRECHDFYHCICHFSWSSASCHICDRWPFAPQCEETQCSIFRICSLGVEVWKHFAVFDWCLLGEALGAGRGRVEDGTWNTRFPGEVVEEIHGYNGICGS